LKQNGGAEEAGLRAAARVFWWGTIWGRRGTSMIDVGLRHSEKFLNTSNKFGQL